MNDIFIELSKFSNDVIELGQSITDDRIEQFEGKYNLKIPKDFKKFQTRFNGANLMGTDIYGFNSEKVSSIEQLYEREHFKVAFPQYDYLIPFSPDGGGNFYCLDISRLAEDGICPIIFWVSNYVYTEIDKPEIVNNSFTEWVKQVFIGWVLEDYNYDGTEKE
jgi:hypothetical protein